ncbi:MAG: phosphoribosylglycinamide formyltransferase [Alphaproteobacteria bacterium]|nr:phosphoribosylglycinamide formyltransferase [Alphaproteobacteria bacterium]
MAPSTPSPSAARTGGGTLANSLKATAENPLRAAVFASGTGTNAENILRHCAENPGIEVAVIITDQPYAGVIERAKKFGVPCEVVPRRKGMDKSAHEADIAAAVEKSGATWIFLAGYMRILQPEFLKKFYDADMGVNRIVNIHPSLLPAFPGRDSYLEAYNAGVKISGVTLHFVDDGVDSGPVIIQRAFERRDNESFESFRARGMAVEYDIYREFLSHLAAGDWRVDTVPGTDRKIVCFGGKDEKEQVS